jgi:hypothetical protein
MPELIRDASHENGISVLYMENLGLFRKIARSESGRALLRNEHDGITWYKTRFQANPSPLQGEFWDSSSFTRLDVARIKGMQARYTRPLSVNMPYVEACVDHYLELWPREPNVPCHGDLTLDNVMFYQPHQAVFFDWEHFNHHGQCWGFDIAYLVLSALVLPQPEIQTVEKRQGRFFLHAWRRLVDAGIDPDLAADPVGYFRAVFTENGHWQTIVRQSPRKLFPMWMTSEQRESISDLARAV